MHTGPKLIADRNNVMARCSGWAKTFFLFAFGIFVTIPSAFAQEKRARVVEAEAEVPRAMAEAFRQGNLGIMDYYRMKNLQADTSMREEIASTGNEPAAMPRK